MLAADGRCKTFAASADGFVRGEGCGMVVLKRLSDAEASGDRVLGVILGSAVNQDGASAGLTVPNGPAQERVIGEALGRAGSRRRRWTIWRRTETGTELGDPVEVEAAASVYGRGRDPERPLLLGSVKTNIGHLEAAAGIAGVIKVLLALRAGVIPKHLHFERPNPRLDWDRLPVRVTSEATAWAEADRPRRAGVSSFGFSGTNAHVILEAPSPRGSPRHPGRRPGSAGCFRFRDGRRQPSHSLRSGYLAWLGERPGGVSLADAAWTAGVGRNHFGVRAGLVFSDEEELGRKLAELAVSGPQSEGWSEPGRVAFLYTGQGSQWAGMGRDLYETEPVVREVLDRCEERSGMSAGSRCSL